MSAVIATPALMEAAATNLSAIGSTLNAAHLTASAPTLSVLPAAADEVSASVACLFSGYARDYQKLAGQASASYEQFVEHLAASAGAYASAEAFNVASLLQPLTGMAASVGAAVPAAQNVVIDLITNLVANTQLVISDAIVLGAISLAVSIFIPWLLADLAAVLLAVTVFGVLTSSPLSTITLPLISSATRVLLETTSAITASYPLLGILGSVVGSAIVGGGFILFLPLVAVLTIYAISLFSRVPPY